MRKITILVAAFAMIAITGCKKEENRGLVPDENGMVTFTTSGEYYTNNNGDKQTYYRNRIMFDNGDQMWFNGVAAAIDCYDINDASNHPTHSYWGKVSVPAASVVDDNVMLYPKELFTAGTAADYSDWTVEMYDEVEMLPSGSYYAALPGAYQSWPMAAHTGTNNFLMKNAVALLAPSIKYDYDFVYYAQLAGKFGTATVSFDEDNLPELLLTKVVLTSTDAKLAGIGHINGLYTDAPTLVMNEDATNGYHITAYPVNELNPAIEPTGSNEYIMGNIPVAPMATGKHLQVTYYFTLTFPGDDATTAPTVFYVKYVGNNVELTGGQVSVLRSQRTTLCCNLADGSPAHLAQTFVQTTPFVD